MMSKLKRLFGSRRFRSVLIRIIYFFWLALIVCSTDLIYSRYFERLPPLRTRVVFQMEFPVLYRRSEIDGLYYELKPNTQYGYFQTNSVGMRDLKEPGKKKDYYRVIMMGDSVTFGTSVHTDETFVAAAEKILRQKGYKVEIFNAGVSGYNTKQEFTALKARYIGLNPDLVVFVFCPNDLGDTLVQYCPQDFVQRALVRRGFDPNGGVYEDLSRIEYLAVVLPKQSILPYQADRWLLLHSGIYRAYSLLSFVFKHGIYQVSDLQNFLVAFDFSDISLKIKELSVRHKFQLRFMIPPCEGKWNREYVFKSLNNAGIKIWDINSWMRREHYALGDLLNDEVHLNPEGHRVLGGLLAERIESLLLSKDAL